MRNARKSKKNCFLLAFPWCSTFDRQVKGSTFFVILQKKCRKICVIGKNILLLHPLNRKRYVHCWYLVRWMSGLVSGLQNRPGRFDSATHLKEKGTLRRVPFLFCSNCSPPVCWLSWRVGLILTKTEKNTFLRKLLLSEY